MFPTLDDAKTAARRLRDALAADGVHVPAARTLELVARQSGARDWNTLHARLSRSAGIGAPVPVVRVFDTALADDFYVRVLGFRLDWEHRFEPGLPRYAQVSRDQARLHLSEHHGDGSPGIVLWVPVGDLESLRTRVLREAGSTMRPGIDADAPGGPTMEIPDPFGNRVRFCMPTPG